VETKIYRLRLF